MPHPVLWALSLMHPLFSVKHVFLLVYSVYLIYYAYRVKWVYSSLILAVFPNAQMDIFQQIFHYTSPFLKYSQSKQEYVSLAKKFEPFKNEAKDHNYVIFTFNKPLKLILFENTIFPNTEYYHHTLFSFEGYAKMKKSKQLSHFIEDKNVSSSQFSTLDFYKIKRDSFKERELLLNFSIFERK